MATDIEIIVGTYEEYVVGYRPQYSAKDPNRLILCKSFADHGHAASVRSVASQEHLIATGGADDKIFLYSLKTREQIDTLLHHNGTVNALCFTPDAKYLLTGGSDGQLAAVNVKKLKREKVWANAHKGAVKHISVHPSGKLALTLGEDMVIRTWNLINGRQAYATNLKNKQTLGGISDHVEWSPEGDYFALTGAKFVEVWSIETGTTVRQQECAARPTGICWISNEELIVGMENGSLMAFNTTDLETNILPVSSDSRIKCMHFLNGLLAVATSNGDVMLFQISENNTQIDEISFTNIGCRPTCLVIVESKKFGIDFEVKEEIDVDALVEQPKVVKSVEKRKPAHFKGVVTVEFEDDIDEAKKSAEEVTSTKKATAKRTPKKRESEPELLETPKSKKRSTRNEVSEEVGELEEIIEEIVVKSSEKKKRAAAESAVMPPPKSSSIKKSKKKSKPEETPVMEEAPLAKKKLQLDDDDEKISEKVSPKKKQKKMPVEDEAVTTPKGKQKKVKAVTEILDVPASPEKKSKKKNSKLNKTVSEVESANISTRVSTRTAMKTRKSVG